jgi:hypothetical protein
MNKKILPALLILIVSVSFFACKKTTSAGADASTKYFPLQMGKYVVYNVDSTFYVDTNCKTTDHISQIRYSVTDTFRDNMNRLSYLMNVYTRANATATWQTQTVIYVTPTASDVETVQDGLRFIKLYFPILTTDTWKGNSYINTADTANMLYANTWTYMYQNYGQSFNNGAVNYSNTVTVLQDDESQYATGTDTGAANIIYRTYAREIYAANIGMVYKQITHYVVPDSTKCKSGFSVVMQAVENN